MAAGQGTRQARRQGEGAPGRLGAAGAGGAAALPHDLEAALARFGHAGFRPGQREAIQILLARGRLLLVAPTGGGKSLTYQLPAALLGGTSFVVSPLIALMHDQVRALGERGVPATFIASTLPASEVRARMARIGERRYRLVYVAPERLVFPGFRALVQAVAPPVVAVDEAHCISEWGHDFRPEYARIGELLAVSPGARVLACTATATPIVRDEILARLGLPPDTPQLVRGFARPNLRLRVREVAGAAAARRHTDALLAEALGAPGRARGAAIVYAPTRRRTEAEAARLAACGWRAAAYHAGMDGAARAEAQERFCSGELEVMVATNAFGMGIDRADVRAVVHLAPPASLEAYYQEVGRAGRDGAPAWGLLVLSPRDIAVRRALIERPAAGAAGPAPEVVEHRWNLFRELLRWAEGGSCRHVAILRYFGDEAEEVGGCGHCDVCEQLARGGGPAPDREQAALLVRKALSGVARVHRRFGLRAAVKLLCGQADERLRWSGLERSPTFGVLRERSERWVSRLLLRCVTAGWVDFTALERPRLALTPEGLEVMKGQRPARVLLPAERTGPSAAGGAAPAGGGRRAPQGAGAREPAPLTGQAAVLFEALRAERMRLARAQQVPPYVVASDRTLRELAALRPRTMAELGRIHGIGRARAARFGRALLAVLARHARS